MVYLSQYHQNELRAQRGMPEMEKKTLPKAIAFSLFHQETEKNILRILSILSILILFCKLPRITVFLKILIRGDAGNEDDKKDNPANDDMRPMFCHARAESVGHNENGSQPTDTGKK